MQKTITGFQLWHGWPVLMGLAAQKIPGQVRYALKKSIRSLEPHWQDILEFIRDDREEYGWEATPNGLPAFPNPFYGRIDAMLEQDMTVDVHQVPEDLLALVDDLSIDDEKKISFLFMDAIPPPPVEATPA